MNTDNKQRSCGISHIYRVRCGVAPYSWTEFAQIYLHVVSARRLVVFTFSIMQCLFVRAAQPLTFMSTLQYIKRNGFRQKKRRSWHVCDTMGPFNILQYLMDSVCWQRQTAGLENQRGFSRF